MLNECVTASSYDLEDSWPTEKRQNRASSSIFCPTDSRIRVADPLPPDLRLTTRVRQPRRLSFLHSSSPRCLLCSFGPSNWYYYGPERPSHYVINVTRVDYRSLFRTCLHCPRTMLDPLPPPPPVPWTRRIVREWRRGHGGEELTPRFNLRDIEVSVSRFSLDTIAVASSPLTTFGENSILIGAHLYSPIKTEVEYLR